MTMRNLFGVAKWCCPLILLLTASTTANAQLTAEALLQSSIEQIGPQHSDVATAIEQFKKGSFVESRESLVAATKKDPKLPPAGILFARLLFAANQPNLGHSEVERVVSSHPEDPESYLLFGELSLQQRRFSESELSFRQAVGLLKNYSANDFRKKNMIRRAYSGLAAVAEAREDWAGAARYLDPITKQDPKDIAATTRLAQALFRQDKSLGDNQGEETNAYQKLTKLYEANPQGVRRPEIIMGTMYQQAGNKALAGKLMELASKKDPQGLETQLSVARWALETANTTLAKTCSSRALQLAPESVQAKLIVGLTARYENDLNAARKALESVHLQAPSNLAALLQLAVVLVEGTDADKKAALEYSQIATRLFNDLSTSQGRESAVTSAWVVYRLGRTTEAQRLLQRVLAGGSVSAESSYYAARIISQANGPYAKRLLEAALKNDGVFPARPDAEQLLRSLGG